MSGLTDRLRQIAGQATPGPWVVADTYRVVRDMPSGTYHMAEMPQDPSGLRDVEYVATFDPVLVEAMLDVIDAAEALVDAPRGSPNGEGLGRAKVRDRLARFREVAG